MAIRRGIEKAVALVVEDLGKISKETKGKSEIAQVGTVSANNDKAIGDIIAEAIEKVGKEGVITVEEAKGMETTLEIGLLWKVVSSSFAFRSRKQPVIMIGRSYKNG